MKHVYNAGTSTNLPVYGVPDKLKDYATSKRDISNSVDVVPGDEYRIYAEDKYQEKSSHSKDRKSLKWNESGDEDKKPKKKESKPNKRQKKGDDQSSSKAAKGAKAAKKTEASQKKNKNEKSKTKAVAKKSKAKAPAKKGAAAKKPT